MLSHLTSLSNITTLLEVTSAESITTVALVCEKTDGRLYVLVNNAGIWYRGPLLRYDCGRLSRDVLDKFGFSIISKCGHSLSE
jgi:NAD(P)-dependent dehydrogenase (short-subunit alcohol dehydrogenase family)